MAIYDSVVDTVGGTPLIRLSRFGKDLPATLLGKMESRNPCASVKDRVGVALIRAKEASGELSPGATIVEATSGNTGIALAFTAAALGYKLIITMPESMSRERVAMLKQFGAEVVLTRGVLMRDAVDKAKEIASNTPGAVQLSQFENPANPLAHENTTAEELWTDTDGAIAAFVAGVGTGGTITGVGRVLKKRNDAIQIIAVEPKESAVLSGQPPGPHYIQGIGAGFVPPVLDRELIDEVMTVTEPQALTHARELTQTEGIFAGISSGANLACAVELARRPAFKGKNIVVMLCDTGERYLSTPLLNS